MSLHLSPPVPRVQLRSAVTRLVDLLLDPRSTHIRRIRQVREVRGLHHSEGRPDELLGEVLVRLLSDLQRGVPGHDHYVRQLTEAADRL